MLSKPSFHEWKHHIMAGWPSGLRRQFKALVFGRGFESHFSQIPFCHRLHLLAFENLPYLQTYYWCNINCCSKQDKIKRCLHKFSLRNTQTTQSTNSNKHNDDKCPTVTVMLLFPLVCYLLLPIKECNHAKWKKTCYVMYTSYSTADHTVSISNANM